MEVRSIDHAADEVLAAIATPEPASGVPQVSSQATQEPVAAGEGEQDQDAPAEVDDDDLFDTPNIRRRSSGLEATAATKNAKLAGVPWMRRPRRSRMWSRSRKALWRSG